VSGNPRIAILGAGNGGQSMVADLVLRGHCVVALYDRFPAVIDPIRTLGGVHLESARLRGFAPLPLLTTEIGEAVAEADVIFVVVPAFAHEYIAEQLAPHVRRGQSIILTPGYLGSTIFRRNIPAASGVVVAETSSLPYATRLAQPGHASIRLFKQWLPIAAAPASETPKLIETLSPLYPFLVPATNVLEAGLNNPNPIIHIGTMLLNLGRIEQQPTIKEGEFFGWVSPKVNRLNLGIERERLDVMRELGMNAIGRADFRTHAYGSATATPSAPEDEAPLPMSVGVPERYLTEDVPMGVVPVADLGSLVGIETPVSRSVIQLSGFLTGRDFWSEGRTLQRMGLAGFDKEALLERLA
jgi:opine dehydrogenase